MAMSKYRVTLEYRPGVLAPTFEAICFAHTPAEAEAKVRELAAECGWWDQKVQRVECVEVAE